MTKLFRNLGSANQNDSQWSVTLVFASEIGEIANLRPLCEQRVIVVASKTEEAALEKARAYAKQEQHEYKNSRGERVLWKFIGVEYSQLLELNNSDIVEVHSQYARRSLGRLKKLQTAQ